MVLMHDAHWRLSLQRCGCCAVDQAGAGLEEWHWGQEGTAG